MTIINQYDNRVIVSIDRPNALPETYCRYRGSRPDLQWHTVAKNGYTHQIKDSHAARNLEALYQRALTPACNLELKPV